MVQKTILDEIERDLLEDQWNIYSEEARDLLLEEDALTPEEAAFMQGYEEAG